jgi:hypothetical protein
LVVAYQCLTEKRKMTQIESADSLYLLYENCDPGLLKRTREAVGMDEGVLARTACLSTAQVRQLESGGGGLFYSITIKRQAYKRVMMILGAEPPTHTPILRADETSEGLEASGSDNQKATIENIVALSSKSDYLERQPVKDFFLDLRYRVIAHRQLVGSFLFLLLAVVVLVLNWQGALSFKSPLNENDVKVMQVKKVDSIPAAPAPVAEASSVAVPLASPVVATPNTAPPEPVALVSAAATNKASSSGAKACSHVDDKLAEVVSSSNNKPANYVYVVSPTPTTVCVVDGAKKATVLDLRSNEGRSVYGSPPWQVSGSALKDSFKGCG